MVVYKLHLVIHAILQEEYLHCLNEGHLSALKVQEMLNNTSTGQGLMGLHKEISFWSLIDLFAVEGHPEESVNGIPFNSKEFKFLQLWH